MKIIINTIPKIKEDIEINEKIELIVRDRNKIIARDFNCEPRDVQLDLYSSPKQIAIKVDPNAETLGIFSGYLEPEDKIMIVHPNSVKGLFIEIWKEISILIDYTLTKFYLCKKYYPKQEDFKLYHKYISDNLALFESGKVKDSIAIFEFKMFSQTKKLRKEQEIFLSFFIMRKYSGVKFIFEHLDEIIQDLNIKTTIKRIYNKPLELLLIAEKEKILLEEKKLKQTFRPGRR